MNEYISIRNQVCPRSSCPFFGAKREGNIVVHSKEHRRLRCKECGISWREHHQKPWYKLQSGKNKWSEAIGLLERGVSIRKVAKRVKVSPSTVQRWKKYKKR